MKLVYVFAGYRSKRANLADNGVENEILSSVAAMMPRVVQPCSKQSEQETLVPIFAPFVVGFNRFNFTQVPTISSMAIFKQLIIEFKVLNYNLIKFIVHSVDQFQLNIKLTL